MKKIAVAVIALLVLVVGAALVMPALIDWSRYREDIATRIEKATGRDVDIAGDVGLRLLPSPAFTAERITIGNIPEAGDQPFAAADSLSIRLRLLPLLTGKVAVESLVLDRPAVHLLRLPDGRANWQFATRQDAPGGDTAPAQAAPEPQPAQDSGDFSVKQIRLRDGLVTYRDGKSAPVTVEAIDATIDAGGPAGPFLGKGDMVVRGTKVAFEAALDRLAEQRGSPAHLTVTLPDTGARAEFSGILSHLPSGDSLRGRLVLSTPDSGRAIPGLPAAPFNAEANLAANAKEVTLDDLVATLGDTRATGAATIGLGERTTADVKLNVASLDLDKLLEKRAAAPQQQQQSAPAPAAPPGKAVEPPAGSFSLPKDVFVTADLGVEALAWKGQVVRQARLEATLDQGEVMIQGATAQLPGGTVVSLAGTLAAERGNPVFDGQAEARSDNLRAVLDWLEV
ncbi:MAG TPA: AsmA family protein, partial [Candidatus Omnitrophota bacterium]|nr:AsmA family protein [Candidatus Omnitrophota bacterium]